jgi:hypothetical protein
MKRALKAHSLDNRLFKPSYSFPGLKIKNPFAGGFFKKD